MNTQNTFASTGSKWLITVGLTLTVIGFVLAIFAPWILTRPAFWPDLNLLNYGPIGDTIGGTAGPFLSAAGAILTFLAFWVQYQANQRQQSQILEQNSQFSAQHQLHRKQQFESQYFESLRFHRENVSNLQLDGYTGPIIFEFLYDELRTSFHVCQIEAIQARTVDKIEISDDQVYQLAFAAFLLGAENLSYRHTDIFEDYPRPFTDLTLKRLAEINLHPDVSLPSISGLPEVAIKRKFHYFAGRSHILGPYIRHLYVTATMLADTNSLEPSDRRNLERILRAQLGIYQQAFIFYNACSAFGRPWIDQGLLPKYVKNVLPSLLYFGPSPESILGRDFAFEWDEVHDRIKSAPSA